MVISLRNAGSDTKTYVLESGSLVEVGCNDDAYSSSAGLPFRSALAVSDLPPGDDVLGIDGWGAARGT